MGEVSPTPEVAARVIEDLTKMDVDPAKGVPRRDRHRRRRLQGGVHPIQ